MNTDNCEIRTEGMLFFLLQIFRIKTAYRLIVYYVVFIDSVKNTSSKATILEAHIIGLSHYKGTQLESNERRG
jgi:hypothetical protein